ncbi:MAG: hypothetical protein AVDCRST_MAG56-1392 [uncultured Cytophagales bacterium]|uniref:Uncharacterized protein n=1 Tax=uncultured Cytophagales bacterium TaxID=158755 RepID=A0A6J4I5P5_9SPHI|nr:MAG: hypothetical protein AVDCRST_MAG56-1392 [uncultured Cytophagales bacterium]
MSADFLVQRKNRHAAGVALRESVASRLPSSEGPGVGFCLPSAVVTLFAGISLT